jgi:Golgi nucleoside diphosphatase
MYESPISVITREVANHFAEEQEQMIFKAVREVGVSVDKDELIRALQYDRQQYERGYRDCLKEHFSFPDGKTKRHVSETMVSLLAPLKSHLDSDTAECIDMVFRMLEETKVDG